MSDRADLLVIRGGNLEVFHHAWGATVLLETLLGGPQAAVDAAAGGARTERLDDILAGVVIDLDRRALVLAGPADVICSGGFAGRRLTTQEAQVLDELSPAWPAWQLGYEPAFVIEPLALYVRGLGLALACLNEPEALSGPRFTACRYHRTGGPVAQAPRAAGPAPEVLRRPLDLDALSVRAANEVRSAGLLRCGDVAGLDEAGLAARGITGRVRGELAEVLAAEGLSLGMTLPGGWER